MTINRAVLLVWFFVVIIFLGDENMKPKKQISPLTIVFQNIHHNHSWDIEVTASLWGIFIYNNVLETLVRLEKNSELVPALASGWTLSPDKKTLKLSISDKYTFHNGKPITPQDVLSSLKATLSSSKTTHSKIADFILDKNLDKSIVLDGKTIEIRLKSPLNALIYKLSIPDMGIIPSGYFQAKTAQERLKNLSGPYKVINFTPEKMELGKHTGHLLLEERSPERVDIVEVSDIDTTVRYYRDNDNVVLVGSGYGKSLRYLNLPEGEKYTSDFAYTEFFLPNTESNHLDTEKKRRNIFSTIKKAFSQIEIDGRVAEKTDQIFTGNNLARLNPNHLKNIYRSDSNKPTKLSVLVFEYVKHNPLPHLISEKLKDLGIELEIITGSDKEIYERLSKKNYDLLFLYSGVSALDPLVEIIYLFNSPLTGPILKTRQFNELLQKAKIEPDRDKYISLLKEIHEDLLKEYRILPLLHTRMVYAAKGDYKLKELGYFDGGFKLWDWVKK